MNARQLRVLVVELLLAHRAAARVDAPAPQSRALRRRAVRRDDRVLQMRLRDRAVAEGEHLAGRGIDVRVRRERVAESPAERAYAECLERGNPDLVRLALLVQREQAIRVPDERRVGGVLGDALWVVELLPLEQPRPERAAALALELEGARANRAVAVAGASALDAHRVQHAVAVEPVMPPERRELRVRPVADEEAVELARQLAQHGH